MSPAGRFLRLLCAALLAAALGAIIAQPRVLPLGLLNDGAGAYDALSAVVAALAASGIVLLLWEVFAGRAVRGASGVRALLFSALLLEGLVTLVDVRFASRGDARLGGPYREVRGPQQDWVVLKKAHPGSPHGFRSAEPYPLRPQGLRVLFVGDSYTEGSGRAAACNYPEVAARVAGARLGRAVEALNAGVAGLGPKGSLAVLRLLVAEGYEFDALVYSLFLENDFTDDLPATERRVVAGMVQRFPTDAFLRAAHPLNTRTFRTLLFIGKAARIAAGIPAAAKRDAGACRLEPEPLVEVPDELAALVRRRLETNYGPEPRAAVGIVERAIEEMAAIARARGVPFALVVFPDRVLVDEPLRAALGIDLSAYDAHRLRRAVVDRLAWAELVDTSSALAAGAENYRPDDTHLSDLGNVRAGTRVGERIAPLLEAARAR